MRSLHRIVTAPAALALTLMFTGCSLASEPFDNGEVSRDNPTPNTMTAGQAQQRAYEDDPNTYCSPDDATGNDPDWHSTPHGDLGFAYLPVFNGTDDEIELEMASENSNSTYVAYSTDRILLASTPLGSGKVPDGAVAKITVRQVTEALYDGWQVRKCGQSHDLEIAPVGSRKLTYIHEDVKYTKHWTIWELTGDGFNPEPKDLNTAGFLADITVGDQTVTAMLTNERTQLPGRYAAPGSALGTADPGMELVRYYYDHHARS